MHMEEQRFENSQNTTEEEGQRCGRQSSHSSDSKIIFPNPLEIRCGRVTGSANDIQAKLTCVTSKHLRHDPPPLWEHIVR